MQNLKVSQTALPDGRIIRYEGLGMPKPLLQDMSNFVKDALMNAIAERAKPKLKLVKRTA